MIANPMLYITAGLMTLSVTSVRSGFDFDTSSPRVTVPRWLPYAVLGVLAVASTAVAIMLPDAIGGELG